MGEIMENKVKTSLIVGNPDNFKFTSYTGKSEVVPFDLFNLDTIRQEVQAHITKHTSRRKALEVLPDEDKFDYYYDKLFNSEKMISNWFGLNDAFFGQYPLELTEIPNWKEYKPILSNMVLHKTNEMIYPYDEGKITFRQFLEIQKEYLKENFPIDWISQKEVKSSQDEVNKLFDRCLQNFKYKPSPQELELFKSANMNTQSSRWLMRKMKGANRKFDLDEYFNRFEITLQNNPQPIYKLCSPFNSALSHNNFDYETDADESNQRVKNLEHRIHILIQDKIENMFKDWFRKKYVGDEIQVIKIDKELYFHTSRTRTGFKV